MSVRWLSIGTLVSSLLLLGLAPSSAPSRLVVSQAGDVECCIQHADQNVVLDGSNIAPGQRSTRHGKRDAPLVEPTAALRVAADSFATAAVDTLRTDATAGTPIVLSLPSEQGGAPVTRYTVLQGPALCGVAGRSFTWIPEGTDPGTYDVRLHAHHADAQPDTLIVKIELTE